MPDKIKNLLFSNTSQKQTMAKNTFWLFSGSIIARILKAILLIYAARVLGADGWGLFSYAFSLAALFTTFIDFGVNGVITRESSRDLSSQQKYFATGLLIKTIMFAAVMVIVFIAAPVLVTDPRVAALLPIVVFMVGLDSFRDFGNSLARAWERMELEAIVQIFTNIMILAAGVAMLMLAKTPQSLAIGYLIGVGAGMIASFYPFRRYFKNIRSAFSTKLIKPILIASWPFGMMGLMGAIMLNTDTVMVGWFRDIAAVGYYGAAQRIIQIIYIVPAIMATVFFPSMARLIGDKERFARVLERGLSLMTLLAVPLTVGGVVLAHPIMTILYGATYDAGAGAFRALSLTFLPVFLSAMFGNAVFSLNHEKKLFIYVILGIAGNFVFNLALIPWLGITGAALSTVINQSIITLYLMWILQKEARFTVLHQIEKIIIATLVMGAVIAAAKVANINLYGIIVLGMLAYFIPLYFAKEEALTEIWEMTKRQFSALRAK